MFSSDVFLLVSTGRERTSSAAGRSETLMVLGSKSQSPPAMQAVRVLAARAQRTDREGFTDTSRNGGPWRTVSCGKPSWLAGIVRR
jgi:hypothetical protein